VKHSRQFSKAFAYLRPALTLRKVTLGAVEDVGQVRYFGDFPAVALMLVIQMKALNYQCACDAYPVLSSQLGNR
jgi:hypothetical protein